MGFISIDDGGLKGAFGAVSSYLPYPSRNAQRLRRRIQVPLKLQSPAPVLTDIESKCGRRSG